MEASPPAEQSVSFDELIELVRSRLRPVLWSRWGAEVGSDLCAEVEEYAWSNQERLTQMENPLGYLYRVAQSKSRRYTRWSRRTTFPDTFPDVATDDPELNEVLHLLAGLSDEQRACVLLVHGFGWAYSDVADALGMSRAAVNNHVHRGLTRIRASHLSLVPIEADNHNDIEPTPAQETAI
jgi:DNA-directed RNA polymerase specialized sigma24 family protein